MERNFRSQYLQSIVDKNDQFYEHNVRKYSRCFTQEIEVICISKATMINIFETKLNSNIYKRVKEFKKNHEQR